MKRAWAFLLLAAAGACGGVGFSDQAGVGSDAEIQGGKVDHGDPAVGLVWMATGGLCTGTLIAPNVVLTAGHCVLEEVEGFYLGTSTGGVAPPESKSMTRYAVAEQVAHPNYDPEGFCPNETFDLGLLRLEKPVPATVALPIPMRLSGPPRLGALCRAVGFGIHREEIGVKYEGVERVTGFDSTSVEVRFHTAIADSGDSGGPLLCGEQIAGATSCHRDGDFPAHRVEYYARVDTAASFIRAKLSAWRR